MIFTSKARKIPDIAILVFCLILELTLKKFLDEDLDTIGEWVFHVFWMVSLYGSLYHILKVENPIMWVRVLFFVQFTTPLILTAVLPNFFIVAILTLPWASIIKMKFILSQDRWLRPFDYLLLLNLIIGLTLTITNGQAVFLDDGNYLYMEFLNSIVTLLFVFLIFRNFLTRLKDDVMAYRETEWYHKWYLSLLLHLGHNIRTPLSAILTNIDVLNFKFSKLEGIKQPLERVKEGGNKLNDIVNSIIHSSNSNLITESGMSITSVVDYFVSQKKAQIHFKSINNNEIKIKGPEIVSILLALDLLTRNALKYGAPPICIEIKENTILFFDSGIGLPKDVIQELEMNTFTPNASSNGNSLKFIFTLLVESGWTISIIKNANGATYEIRRGIRNWAEKAIS